MAGERVIRAEDALGHLYALAYRQVEESGGDPEAVNRLCEMAAAQTGALMAERDRANRGRRHVEEWYSARIARIEALAKEKGFWPEVAAILANGTVTATDPPNYERQMAVLGHRVTDAEIRAEAAEREAAALRGELKAAREAGYLQKKR